MYAIHRRWIQRGGGGGGGGISPQYFGVMCIHCHRLTVLELLIVTIFTDKEINKFNLPDIMDILRPVRNRWTEIGTALLLNKYSLDDFENNPELVKEGPEGFLRETLNTVEHLTVRAVASALRSPSLQEEERALLLEEHFLLRRGSTMCISLLLFPHVFCLYLLQEITKQK